MQTLAKSKIYFLKHLYMSSPEYPIHIVRTWWSIDQVYHTEGESDWFDTDKSPVIHTLNRLWLRFQWDHRISWVNSSDLTEDHLEALMKVLWRISSDTRIIITSGTRAIPRIAGEIDKSKFLKRSPNNGWSNPNIVQVASHIPGSYWDRGDIRDSLSIAHATVSADTTIRWQHLIVVWRTLLFASDILSWKSQIPDTPDDMKVVF